MPAELTDHEQYLLGVLRAAFPEATHVESFENETFFSITFPDGCERDLTLHTNWDDDDEDDENDD